MTKKASAENGIRSALIRNLLENSLLVSSLPNTARLCQLFFCFALCSISNSRKLSCCNCGLCTYYACNFGLKPSQVMQTLKSAIASKGVRPRKEVYGPVDGGLENKKVPVERLIARLGIAEYDVPAPMAEKPLTTSCVRIALSTSAVPMSIAVCAS